MNDYNIKELYEEMEMHLIKSMQRNLSRHLKEESEVGFEYPQWQAIKLKELKKYQRENKRIIKKYTFGLNKDVSENLQKELRQGSLEAIKQYNEIHKRKLNPDKLMTKSFFKTNQRKVNNLIKVVNNDLNKVNTSALRMMNDQYRQIIHKSAFFVGNGVITEKQASEMAAADIYSKKTTMQAVDEASKNFLAGGLNCIEYKDGRRVNIASYSEMAVRTASLRAHLMGEGDFRKSIGRSLVKVTTHGGACKLCTAWQGKVLVDDVYSGGEPDGKHTLLSEAMAQGFLHPNCKHGLTTYYPELEEDDYIEEDDDDELQDKINYYNRQEKRYDRLYNGSIDLDNRRMYKHREILCEKKKNEVIKINTPQYKNYYRAIKNGYWNGNMKYCDNVTEDWLGVKRKSINTVISHKNGNIIKYKGKEYFIDDYHIRIDFKKGEPTLAEEISKLTDKRIELFPRFDYFKSTDSKIGRDYVDFKITTSGTDKFIFNNINEAKEQSNHFIFWIKNKEIPDEVINYQIDDIFRRIKTVKTVGFYRNKKLTIYKRK